MTIEKIVDYVLHTPHNTNKAILIAMLEELIRTSGGNVPEDPDTPEKEVVYDGGGVEGTTGKENIYDGGEET